MRSGSVIVVVGVLAVLLTATAAWSAPGPNGPDPAVKEWPNWPYLTQCGEGLSFDPVAAFSGSANAERGSSPSEVALRDFIEQGDLPWLRSTRNWRHVASTEGQAEFSRGRLSGELEWLSFAQREGAWEFSGYSSHCHPVSKVGNGPAVGWDLAGNELKPKAELRRIQVSLSGGPCSGGRPLGPRARVVFKGLGRKLLMTIWIKPFHGPRTCPGVFEPPLTVSLPRRIRLDRLFDGATYPPTPAIEHD
jgi:hypothetical protein